VVEIVTGRRSSDVVITQQVKVLARPRSTAEEMRRYDESADEAWRGAVVLHLRPSRDQVAEHMRSSRGIATFFPLVASYRFCEDRRAGREQVELGSSLKHERREQESREPREKGEGESCWKSDEGQVRLYPFQLY